MTLPGPASRPRNEWTKVILTISSKGLAFLNMLRTEECEKECERYGRCER